MKTKIFVILFFLGLSYSFYAFDSDVFYYKSLENKGIKKIEETFDKWQVSSSFNNEGFLIREINIYKKEIRSDYQYEYTVTDTLLEIKRTNLISTAGSDSRRQRIDRYYYNSLGQCYKYRVYFSEYDKPSHYEDNFVFDDGMLVSYTQGENGTVKFVYTYNDNKQKIQVQKTGTSDNTSTTLYSYIYDKSGQLTDFIHEVVRSDNDDIVVLSGVVVYGKNNTNKSHVRYSNFDKRGNWTRSHFVTEKGKVFRSKRKIEYW